MPFNWIEKQQAPFDISKAKLCEEPLLQRPNFPQPFILTTHASECANLSDTEKNMIHMRKELLL